MVAKNQCLHFSRSLSGVIVCEQVTLARALSVIDALRDAQLMCAVKKGGTVLKEGLVVIKALKSKNNQLCKGDEVVISQLSSLACPFELLKR